MTMNSKLSMIPIYGVLMISVIFIMAQSNTNGKVFAQTGVAGNDHSATSKANTVTNATSSHTASNAYLNFNRAEGTIANIQYNESGKPTWSKTLFLQGILEMKSGEYSSCHKIC